MLGLSQRIFVDNYSTLLLEIFDDAYDNDNIVKYGSSFTKSVSTQVSLLKDEYHP